MPVFVSPEECGGYGGRAAPYPLSVSLTMRRRIARGDEGGHRERGGRIAALIVRVATICYDYADEVRARRLWEM
jgi:hypothetical protein